MSCSRNWEYDVFPSFRGVDVRETFLSHFFKEVDLKPIKPFKDSEIERSHSIAPELIQAIRNSRIAVVVFSEKYATSTWCLDELVEIVKCKKESGQIVIPIFYALHPNHVRKQWNKFGEAFKNTCLNQTEDKIQLWRQALTDVANLAGYHSHNYDNEAKMIEDIVADIIGKLNETPSKDFDNFVGINDHIAKMITLLYLESEEAKMVGIWGPLGIGKTTIARALFNRISPQFQVKVFVDRAFLSKSIEGYQRAKTYDHNMKLSLQGKFLSKILGKSVKTEHLDALGERLKNRKVLLFIDDLDSVAVLDILAGQTQWFGNGSRIIVVTEDKHLLESHGIYLIYKVGLPSEEQALEMVCQSAFGKHSPPDGFLKLASEVASLSGRLPLALEILGKVMKGRNMEGWIDMLLRLRKSPNKEIVDTLRFSYDELDSEDDKAIFRHIACFFNGEDINYIKMMLADSDLTVNIGIQNLVDKSLINVAPSCNNMNIVEMHCLVQEMGKEEVRKQSNKPGEREFLMNSKEVCNVLSFCTGTEKVLGISLDIDEVWEVEIHKNAFEGMSNLRFLKFYKSSLVWKKGFRWKLPKGFNYFPDKLKLLSWPGYPMRRLPSNFCPRYLVELTMPKSKLEKLWEGNEPLQCLKRITFSESQNLREIPDLSTAINLESLVFNDCSTLTYLPSISTPIVNFSTMSHLEKLVELYLEQITCERLWDGFQPFTNLKKFLFLGCAKLIEMQDLSMAARLQTLNLSDSSSLSEVTLCTIHNLNKLMNYMTYSRLKTLPEGINLPSLRVLDLIGCSNLTSFPRISENIVILGLNQTGIREVPRWIENFHSLVSMKMRECSSLEILPEGINLPSLEQLDFHGCSRLRSFPNISNNISDLNLSQTAIEEVPIWIENFISLKSLKMQRCKQLNCISPRIFKLDNIEMIDFSDCEGLTEVTWPEKAKDTNDARSKLRFISFSNCFSLNQEPFIQQSTSKLLVLPGVEVPSYFNYRSTGSSLTIPLHCSSSRLSFLEFKSCILVSEQACNHLYAFIQPHLRFRDKHGNYHEAPRQEGIYLRQKMRNDLVIFHCQIPLAQDYNQVDLQFGHDTTRLKLKGCGIRLSNDCILFPDTQNETDESKAGYKELKRKEQMSLFKDCSSVENRHGYKPR